MTGSILHHLLPLTALIAQASAAEKPIDTLKPQPQKKKADPLVLDDVQEAMSSSGGPMKEMLEKGGTFSDYAHHRLGEALIGAFLVYQPAPFSTPPPTNFHRVDDARPDAAVRTKSGLGPWHEQPSYAAAHWGPSEESTGSDGGCKK